MVNIAWQAGNSLGQVRYVRPKSTRGGAPCPKSTRGGAPCPKSTRGSAPFPKNIPWAVRYVPSSFKKIFLTYSIHVIIIKNCPRGQIMKLMN